MKRNRKKKEEKEKDLAVRTEIANQNIKKLEDHIQALIQLANKCMEEGIDIPNKFWSDCIEYLPGICIARGFIKPDDGKKIQYVGMSFSGLPDHNNYDFCTDGNVIFTRKGKNEKYNSKNPYAAEQFLTSFDEFETSFYTWLERMVDED